MPSQGTIDGVTYSGFWLTTKDNANPIQTVLTPKDEIYFKCSDDVTGEIHHISDSSASLPLVNTDAGTLDHEGNLLDTSEKVSQYLTKYR